jgi:hypothetical protein
LYFWSGTKRSDHLGTGLWLVVMNQAQTQATDTSYYFRNASLVGRLFILEHLRSSDIRRWLISRGPAEEESKRTKRTALAWCTARMKEGHVETAWLRVLSATHPGLRHGRAACWGHSYLFLCLKLANQRSTCSLSRCQAACRYPYQDRNAD